MTLTPTQSRALAWGAMALVAGALLNLLSPVLMPFVLAAVLAYALQPLVERLHAWRVPRWLGAGVALALLCVAIMAVVLLIVPVVTRQAPLLRDQLPALLEQFNQWLQPLSARFGLELSVDVAAVRDVLRKLVSGHGGDIWDGVVASLRIGGSALAAVLGNLMLAPIVTYYLLLDWSGLMARLRHLVPPRALGPTMRFLDETDAVLGQYLRGQLLVMGSLAVFYTVGLALVGLKLALPIGVFTGLAVFVPYLGFGLGLVMGLMAAALQFQDFFGLLLVAGVYGVGQVLESMFITPKLLGERIGLHPIAVIFALLAFGHLFGFVGVLVALPVSAVLLVAVRRAQTAYLASEMYTGTPAGPGPGASAPATPLPADPGQPLPPP
jgi:predicted PurR-regulated permease PerM